MHSSFRLHQKPLHVGVPIEIVSKRVGHANVSTMLAVYAHLYEGADRVAAEKLDRFFEEMRVG